MADRVAHIVQVVRRPSLGRLLGAFGLFSIAENGTWLAVTVFAFQRGVSHRRAAATSKHGE